uniref:Uncharacterized protein n=1 Tax=Romanomermis culicivorax TaxID=13658 RepID=A0A915HHU9_ROMCU
MQCMMRTIISDRLFVPEHCDFGFSRLDTGVLCLLYNRLTILLICIYTQLCGFGTLRMISQE